MQFAINAATLPTQKYLIILCVIYVGNDMKTKRFEKIQIIIIKTFWATTSNVPALDDARGVR